MGPFSISEQVVRIDGGATARLGVRFIPTFHIGLGAEGRRTSAPSGLGPVRDALLGVDLVGVAAIGFDYRWSARTVLGVSARASYAVPLGGASFATLEATIAFRHYWYPRW